MALLVLVLTGVVPAGSAFSGFAHPAVITVAAILVISRGLERAGLVELVGAPVRRFKRFPFLQLGLLCVGGAVLSMFMNNVGALALLMPVALQAARETGTSPSRFMMPLAFATLLGGLATLIGTPPNILISDLRQTELGIGYAMFDFTPVGGAVAVVGAVLVVAVGWFVVPRRRPATSRADLFELSAYTTEVKIPDGSALAGKPLSELTGKDGRIVVAFWERGERTLPIFQPQDDLVVGDKLILETNPQTLRELVAQKKLALVGSKEIGEEGLKSDDVALVEAVVTPGSKIEGRTAMELNLRRRHSVNLLAVSRSGERIDVPIGRIRFRAGDVLLLQGQQDLIHGVLSDLECLPLASRELQLLHPRRLLLAAGIFALGIVLTVAGVLRVEVAFVLAAVLMLMARVMPARDVYTAIDWPVIVLLGALMPVGEAFESSGAAANAAGWVALMAERMPVWATLGLLMGGTMALSAIINNAAVALLMGPLALRLADTVAISPDVALMTIAIGASASFLTPIGHQCNALVLGPGGYRFGDYWRLGLPLTIATIAIAVPAILRFWN